VIENVDRRVLAGIRCVDAITATSVLNPLKVVAAPLTLVRTASGVFAVLDAPGVSRNATQALFPVAASWPAPVNYEIRIDDPSLRYLPRRATIAAPQPLPPDASATATTTTPAPGQPGPVTVPQVVVLYPGPAAPLAPNWAVIRVSVTAAGATATPLPWAVIQVTGIAGVTLVGVTNQLGEALLAAPGLGLKLSSSATGSVTETTFPATVNVRFDPSTLKQAPDWVPDPDGILRDFNNPKWLTAPPQQAQLGPGQTAFVKFSITVA
jgi:hypothetical protein